jgi:hypothetical protein
MGGKDGGGGGGGQYSEQALISRGIDPRRLQTDAAYYNAVAANGFMSAPADPAPAPAAAPQAAPAAFADAPAPAAPAPAPEVAPPAPSGPAASAGGPIPQPTAAGNPTPGNTGGTQGPSSGDVLGGSVMAPPNYWVGGLGQSTSTGRTRGNITTSQ